MIVALFGFMRQYKRISESLLSYPKGSFCNGMYLISTQSTIVILSKKKKKWFQVIVKEPSEPTINILRLQDY